MNLNKTHLVRGLLTFAALLCTGSFLQGQAPSVSQPLQRYHYKWFNQKLPLDTLVSYQGDTLIISGAKKSYVISFWLTTCPPCRAEAKWLNKLKAEYESDSLGFIAITFEPSEELMAFLKDHPFSFEHFYLEQKIINELSLARGYPTNLLLNSKGIVVFYKAGGYADEERAEVIYTTFAQQIKEHFGD